MNKIKKYDSFLNESDNQTYKKLSFVRDCIKNIRKTLKDINWEKATENEKIEIYSEIEKLLKSINENEKVKNI